MGCCRIPFNKPSLVGHEMEYARQAAESRHLASNGPFTRKCEALLAALLGVDRCLLTSSGTSALEMAALLLNVKAGDEVIVPAFTFPSTVGAFASRGARPVFIDVRPDTLNMDEARLEALLTPATKAVVPVHYAGVGCELDTIMAISSAHNVAVVEDNAHGLFATYKDRPLGSFGMFAAQSFHETKNFTCGEGGALLISDPAVIDRAEFLIESGTDRRRFQRGQVAAYTWVEVGSGHPPSEIQAALLYGQLEQRQRIQDRRRQIFERYEALLRPHAESLGLQLVTVPPHCAQSYHMFYVLLPTEVLRDRAIRAMRDRGILSAFHYMPLHLSAAGRRYGVQRCPVTESVSSRLLRLPFYVTLSAGEQEEVVEALLSGVDTVRSRA
jgi:dTDP-4-amino-4,6-dideoxygalactose transaminase